VFTHTVDLRVLQMVVVVRRLREHILSLIREWQCLTDGVNRQAA
jgi:hypothetical protein